jgi:hypothetical protein
MRFADYFSNSAPVPNLGTRKAKALTLLDKPVVEKYLEGGPLGDIPHDDVADMSVRELEEEIRKLRQKIEKTEKVARERIRQKDEQITKLEFENENRVPPTQEQIAQAALEAMTPEYTIVFAEITGAIRKAHGLVMKAEKIEGVNVQQLGEWLGQFSPDMQTFRDLAQTWADEADNAGPIADWRISDLPGGEAQA